MPVTRRQTDPERFAPINWANELPKIRKPRRPGTRTNPFYPPALEHDYTIPVISKKDKEIMPESSTNISAYQSDAFSDEMLQEKFGDCESVVALYHNHQLPLTNRHVSEMFNCTRRMVGRHNRPTATQLQLFNLIKQLLIDRNLCPAKLTLCDLIRKIRQLNKFRVPLAGPDVENFHLMSFNPQMSKLPTIEKIYQPPPKLPIEKEQNKSELSQVNIINDRDVVGTLLRPRTFKDYRSIADGNGDRMLEPGEIPAGETYLSIVNRIKNKYRNISSNSKMYQPIHDGLKSRLTTERRINRTLKRRLDKTQEKLEKYLLYSNQMEKHARELKIQLNQMYREKVKAEVERDSYLLDLEEAHEQLKVSEGEEEFSRRKPRRSFIMKPPKLIAQEPYVVTDDDIDSDHSEMVIEPEEMNGMAINEIEVETSDRRIVVDFEVDSFSEQMHDDSNEIRENEVLERRHIISPSVEPLHYIYVRPQDITLA